MKNKHFGKRMEKRTLDFSVSVIKLSTSLSFNPEQKAIRNQITRSATSIGANYREANRSRSAADFRNKIKICESETNETIYWLELIKKLNLSNGESLSEILMEANELLAIFTTIANKLERKNDQGNT